MEACRSWELLSVKNQVLKSWDQKDSLKLELIFC